MLTAHAELVEELAEFARDADADLAALLHAELREAVDRYRDEKQRLGRLDFLDLLLRTRDLVRDQPDVRADFQRRFTHLFVDEFQDTDPLQAEILLLLSADDPGQADWREVVPEPGKLFLVGDPKQSIYRFRRADVGIYLDVRDRLVEQGARRVDLTTSFRSAPGIQRVVNSAFEGLMDGNRDTQQASWVPLTEHREEPEGRPSVVVLPVPAPYGRTGRVTKTAIQESLPDATAAFVDWLLHESGWQVTERDVKDRKVDLAPRHICLLFRRFDSWWAGDVTRGYVDALEARNIRHLLVGGRSFHEREEVETLRTALLAIERPDDELSVFATLKGPLFAVGDEELLEYRQPAAGKTRRLSPLRIPDDLPERLEPIADGLRLLGRLHRNRNRRPIAETVHRLLEATRAHATFVLRPSGEQALANVLHVAEQARLYERTGGISFRGFVERLVEDAGARKASEAPILEEGSEGVRLMTVHRAKGLEFPVVILADISADAARNNASRVVRGDTCAVRLAGWAPADLLDHEDEEVERDRAEGIRLAYVAATRARDLLVVPGIGDGAWGDPDGESPGSWTHPLNRAVYPPFEAWAAAESSPGCPPFGADTVHDRPHDPEGETRIRPGRHRVGEAAVTWWDPGALRLGVPVRQGVRREDLLSPEVDDASVAADVQRFRDWESARETTLLAASDPSRVVRTVREHAVFPDSVDAHPVDVVRLERSKKRPRGPRFGALVHAALATVPMNATEEGVRSAAEMQGRVLGATAAEVRAAAVACANALAHPILARARETAERGGLRREVPVSRSEPDGVLVEGVVDLAFREVGGWTVVDFKTDQEIEADLELYRRQVALYASMISTVTGEPAQTRPARGLARGLQDLDRLALLARRPALLQRLDEQLLQRQVAAHEVQDLAARLRGAQLVDVVLGHVVHVGAMVRPQSLEHGFHARDVAPHLHERLREPLLVHGERHAEAAPAEAVDDEGGVVAHVGGEGVGDGIRGVTGRSHLGDGERPVEAREPRDGIPREAALDRLDGPRPVLAGRSERADLAALQRLHALHRLDCGEDVGQQQVALAVREDRGAPVSGTVQHLEEAQCSGIAGQRAFHRLPARDLAPGRGRRLHHEVDRLLRDSAIAVRRTGTCRRGTA